MFSPDGALVHEGPGGGASDSKTLCLFQISEPRETWA